MFAKIESIISRVNTWTGIGCGIIALAMCGIITFDVVMRYLFVMPTTWAGEISGYIIVVAGFMGLGYTTLVRSHVRVDLVLIHLPSWLRDKTEVVTAFAGVIYSVFLIIGSYRLALEGFIRHSLSNSLLRIPLFPVYIWLVIGSIFLFLQLTLQFRDKLRAVRPAVDAAAPAVKVMREDKGL